MNDDADNGASRPKGAVEPRPPDGRDRLGTLVGPRESAFPEALRHSARVTRLRRVLLWGAAGVTLLVGVTLVVSALRLLAVNFSLDRVAMKGSRIIIEEPKLVGYRKDGRPYELRAKVGSQDMAKPNVFDLEKLEVRVENTAESVVTLNSAQGVYNGNTDHADLSGGVTIRDDKNFNIEMDAAQMDFKQGVMTSDKPVRLKIIGGEVNAKAVEFSQHDRRATFTGGVRSTLYGEDGAPVDSLRRSQ